MNWKLMAVGLVFALLWSSASSATKFGLQSAQPFVMAVTRFLLAGALMLFIAHVLLRYPLPGRSQWRPLVIYGLLNISIYLGLFVLAMQRISAGLGSLAIAVNPVMMSFLAAAWFGHRVGTRNILSLVICSAGVLVAAYPLLQKSYAHADGILLLMVSMLAYSTGALYYSRRDWGGLQILVINGWQTLIGGLCLLPVLWMTYQPSLNHYDLRLAVSVAWLAIPVSIGAMQCWMFLLNKSAMKATYWLFLCPLFGFILAHFLLDEPVGLYTLAGIILVIVGLYMVQRLKPVTR